MTDFQGQKEYQRYSLDFIDTYNARSNRHSYKIADGIVYLMDTNSGEICTNLSFEDGEKAYLVYCVWTEIVSENFPLENSKNNRVRALAIFKDKKTAEEFISARKSTPQDVPFQYKTTDGQEFSSAFMDKYIPIKCFDYIKIQRVTVKYEPDE